MEYKLKHLYKVLSKALCPHRVPRYGATKVSLLSLYMDRRLSGSFKGDINI